MASFASFLSNVDSYAQQVRLSIGKRDTVSTGFGGALTLSALAITLILSIGTISDFLHHTHPTVSFAYDYFPDPGFLDLNSSNFLFSITDQDTDYFLDSAILSFNLYYVVLTRMDNGTTNKVKYPIPLVRCILM